MPRSPVVDWLTRYRLQEAISYETLALRMTLALGMPIKTRNLHNVMNRTDRRPHETTLYNIAQFRKIAERKKRRKKRVAKTAAATVVPPP